MRNFHSYGPVDPEIHYSVERKYLVQQCLDRLIGNPKKGGHYFTIWAPRQTGKTWLIQQVEEEITQREDQQFAVCRFSLGTLREMIHKPSLEEELPRPFQALLKRNFPQKPEVKNWQDFFQLFSREGGLWDRPLLLLLDEVDAIPSSFLKLLVNQFRELYLERKNNHLHSLALVGVKAVVGVDSKSGSPFNVQRSLGIPNLTGEEVKEMFRQYQEESGQQINAEVPEELFQITNGQPGLVGWLGELLTEKFNTYPDQPLGLEDWESMLVDARYIEPNNTLMNLISKAREVECQEFLFQLFSNTKIPFVFHESLINYLYMNGVITFQKEKTPTGKVIPICRFSSDFVQKYLFDVFSGELKKKNPVQIAPLEMRDALEDVLDGPQLNLPALMQRYRDYLGRLKKAGINPWKDQPRNANLNIKEAVGHFHLFAWLQRVIENECIVSPEFPTGNGQLDIHISFQPTLEAKGIIEIKSFINVRKLQEAREQSAGYAKSLNLQEVTLVVFAPFILDEEFHQLSGTKEIQNIQVHLEAIGMMEE